jgi:hypothetical protein
MPFIANGCATLPPFSGPSNGPPVLVSRERSAQSHVSFADSSR